MIARQLRQLAEKQPDHIALQIRHADGRYSKVSYGDLYKTCLKVSSDLSARGFKPGDHISVYAENSPSWVISYLSVHFLGGVVVPMDALLGAEDILNFLNFAGVKGIISDADHLESTTEVLTNEKSGIKIIQMEPLISEAGTESTIDPHEPESEDLIVIVFTSGTTGVPKGVQLSNRNILSNVKAILKEVHVTPKDNVLNILPLHHGYSSIVALITPLWAGATVTFSESIKSRDLMAAIKETGVTIFPGVPRLFELLYNEIDQRVGRLPSTQRLMYKSLSKISEQTRKKLNLKIGKFFFSKMHEPFGKKFRFFTSGGAKINPEVLTNYFTLGFRIAEGYGLTETSAVSTLTSPDKPTPGKAGKPLPGVELRIDNPDGFGIGEICIKGPNITPGYYKNRKATSELIRDGWLHTGDLGSLDSEGNVEITGRANEMIVLPSGKNIYPEDVESLYKKSPLIKELCVLALKSKTGSVTGLRMVAVPDMKEVKERGVFDILERIRSAVSMAGSSLPSYMQISQVLVCNEELPKTRLGKFKRKEVEAIADDIKTKEQPKKGTVKVQDLSLLEKPDSALFLKRFSDITDIEGPFKPDDDLTLDLGLDSLILVEVSVLLEDEFGVFIPEEEIPEIRTVGDILKRIGKHDARKSAAREESDLLDDIARGKEVEPLDEIFNLNRGFFRRTAIRIIQLFLRGILMLAFKTSFKESGKIPLDKAVLICPNHQSLIDPLLIFALLPGDTLERTLFTGFGEYFSKPPLSWIVHPMRIILTGTSRTSGDSLKLASEGLRRGMSVCIFPEGERTSTGRVMNPKIGAGLLSVENDAPIIPVYIDGATTTLSPINPGLKFPEVTLTVMDPIEPVDGDKDKKELFRRTVDRWRDVIREMEKDR